MAIDIKKIIEIAEQNNELLNALMSHPQLNVANPPASPKPLYFATDFVRKTYLEYIIPLLPEGAILKSSRVANSHIFGYGPEHDSPPMPAESADEWLLDERNWPATRESPGYRQRFNDAVSRTMMIPLGVNDPVKGAFMLGGQFDWERPVNIREITRRIMPS